MKKVNPIPKGYHSISPYLIVKNAAEAIEFYKKAFGAVETVRMNKPDGKIGHAEIRIGDSVVMLADEFPEYGCLGPDSFGGSPQFLHLYVEDADAVARKAEELGAELVRAVEDHFYGDRAGMIKDPFGHQWYIATHVEDLTVDEIRQRAEANPY